MSSRPASKWGRAIGRAIIDHQHLAAIRQLRDGRGNVIDLVIHRQSGKRLQRHITIVPREKQGEKTERAENGGRGLRFHPHRIGSRSRRLDQTATSANCLPRHSAKHSTANRSLAKCPGKSNPMPAASASRQV